jgi:hypothetical protein
MSIVHAADQGSLFTSDHLVREDRPSNPAYDPAQVTIFDAIAEVEQDADTIPECTKGCCGPACHAALCRPCCGVCMGEVAVARRQREALSPVDYMTEFFGEPIHVYTRAQALADGQLVDVTETAREAGFTWPVAMTQAAWHDLVHWDEETEKRKGFTGQSESGRLWDVLYMAMWAARRNAGTVETRYQMIRTPEPGRGVQPRKVVVKLVTGPGDDAEPVVTLMLPEES